MWCSSLLVADRLDRRLPNARTRREPTVALAARWRPEGLPSARRLALAEQTQQGRRRGIGDRQGLDAKLLLGLQGLQGRALLGEVGVHEVADAGRQRVLKVRHEVEVRIEGLRRRAERSQRIV